MLIGSVFNARVLCRTGKLLRKLAHVTTSRVEEITPTGPSVLGALRQLPQKNLLWRAAFLGVAEVMAAAVILPLGWAITHKWTGVFAGAAAGGLCLLAAWMALALSEPLRKPPRMLTFVLVGMMIRMGVPLVAASMVFFMGGPLADAGFLYYLIVFYLVTLSTETFLSLPIEKKVPPANDIVG